MYTDTQLGYARTIVEVGRQMNIAPRGIQIALATALVETNLWNYANAKVPGSLDLPHDRVGDDGLSVGLFQQQVRTGLGGAWWWGPVVDCQDPAASARMFYDALARLGYEGGNSPGWYAQAVQRSAFPDRYDQRMPDAIALYQQITGGTVSWYDKDRSNEFTFGRPRSTAGLVGICLHTTESAPGATADDVTSYQARSQTGSYNVMVDDHTTILQNTDDWQVWASGNKGNDILLHLCFVGRAAWSRAEWLTHMPMLQRGATVAAHWCKTYGFPARWVDVYSLPGITTHDATRAWGGTDHTDPGPGFPSDLFCQMVQNLIDGRPQEDDMTEDDRRMLREVHDALYTPRPSLVKGSTAQFSLIDFVRLIDAAAWHLNNPEAK